MLQVYTFHKYFTLSTDAESSKFARRGYSLYTSILSTSFLLLSALSAKWKVANFYCVKYLCCLVGRCLYRENCRTPCYSNKSTCPVHLHTASGCRTICINLFWIWSSGVQKCHVLELCLWCDRDPMWMTWTILLLDNGAKARSNYNFEWCKCTNLQPLLAFLETGGISIKAKGTMTLKVQFLGILEIWPFLSLELWKL